MFICVQNEHCTKPFAYFPGIMLNAFTILLCSLLCWHIWLKRNNMYTDNYKENIIILTLCIQESLTSKTQVCFT